MWEHPATLGVLHVSMLVMWCQAIMAEHWLSEGVPTAVNVAGCEQHGANVSRLWQQEMLRYSGCEQ